jgi:hypothetical protein
MVIIEGYGIIIRGIQEENRRNIRGKNLHIEYVV